MSRKTFGARGTNRFTPGKDRVGDFSKNDPPLNLICPHCYEPVLASRQKYWDVDEQTEALSLHAHQPHLAAKFRADYTKES